MLAILPFNLQIDQSEFGESHPHRFLACTHLRDATRVAPPSRSATGVPPDTAERVEARTISESQQSRSSLSHVGLFVNILVAYPSRPRYFGCTLLISTVIDDLGMTATSYGGATVWHTYTAHTRMLSDPRAAFREIFPACRRWRWNARTSIYEPTKERRDFVVYVQHTQTTSGSTKRRSVYVSSIALSTLFFRCSELARSNTRNTCLFHCECRRCSRGERACMHIYASVCVHVRRSICFAVKRMRPVIILPRLEISA